MTSKVLITGGAGFIGSHYVDHLLGVYGAKGVTVYDNFSSGQRWHLEAHVNDPRLSVVEADIHDRERLASVTQGHDLMIHLASNPDIARSATEPDLDFDEGTVLVRNVLEAMRLGNCRQILYVSGSGVYGDLGEKEAIEDTVDVRPVSTYGAGKLAGEGLIAAYTHMFGFRGYSFRLGNVVGPRQTHGVGFDFIRKLKANPDVLEILGDGTQSKSYIHVTDVIAGMLGAFDACDAAYDVFNLASGDYIMVREIADLAVEVLGLPNDAVERRYGDNPRGWKGDVPIIRLSTDKIRELGWKPRYTSASAMRAAIEAMLDEPRCWHVEDAA